MTNLVQLAQTALTYSNLAVQLMVGDANFYAEKLKLKESLPIQTSNLVASRVTGRTMAVSGVIRTPHYRFEFHSGELIRLSRTDLLNSDTAESAKKLSRTELRALSLNYLAALQFDTNYVARHYPCRTYTKPWEDGHDNNSKSTPLQITAIDWGHGFDGEVGRDQFFTVGLEFLPATGECVGFNSSSNSGDPEWVVNRRAVLQITQAADIKAPEFFVGIGLTTNFVAQIEPVTVKRLVREAHAQMRKRMGTNQA